MNGLSNPSAGSGSFENSDEGESESSSSDPYPHPPSAMPLEHDDRDDPAGQAVALTWHRPVDHELDAWLTRQFAAVAALTGVNPGLISLAIVDDAEMAELHEQYKGVPGTTDVLTFDLRENEGDAVEGDVILCFDEADRQAKKRSHALSHELLLYAVHGLLHLLDYDDHDEVDAAAMHAREDELLTQIGLGPVFATGASDND